MLPGQRAGKPSGTVGAQRGHHRDDIASSFNQQTHAGLVCEDFSKNIEACCQKVKTIVKNDLKLTEEQLYSNKIHNYYSGFLVCC